MKKKEEIINKKSITKFIEESIPQFIGLFDSEEILFKETNCKHGDYAFVRSIVTVKQENSDVENIMLQIKEYKYYFGIWIHTNTYLQEKED